MNLAGAIELRVLGDIFAIIKAKLFECRFAEIAHTMCLARGEYEVVRRGLLHHQIHAAHIIGGMPPIPSRSRFPNGNSRAARA